MGHLPLVWISQRRRDNLMRMILATLLMLALSIPVFADCTDKTPCGPVPWKMPVLPRLLTPTPMPNSSGSVTGIFGPTPVPDTNASADLGDTNFFDGSALNKQVGDLKTLMSNQNTMNGTGQDLGVLVSQSGDFFSYLRAFATANFGVFTPLLLIAVLSFSVKMGLGVSTRLFPVFMAIYGFVRKAITVILDFIPL